MFRMRFGQGPSLFDTSTHTTLGEPYAASLSHASILVDIVQQFFDMFISRFELLRFPKYGEHALLAPR